MQIPERLRRQVVERANGQCEYCKIHENCSSYTHEVDHLIARKHGGQTSLDNLALACLACNRHKGSDFATIDPVTEKITPLFNPRRHHWSVHFVWQQYQIQGRTDIGQATVKLLQLNHPQRLLQRQILMPQGRYDR